MVWSKNHNFFCQKHHWELTKRHWKLPIKPKHHWKLTKIDQKSGRRKLSEPCRNTVGTVSEAVGPV